jgi:hypothetical protein
MRFFARWLFVIASAAALYAADATPGADVLNRWVGGKWVGSGQFVESGFSKANKSSAVTTCVWSPDHIFVICDQDINLGGTPMRDLSIYAFAPQTNKFHHYAVSLSQEKPRNSALDISENDDRWVYSSIDHIKGKSVAFRTVDQFRGADTVLWRSEFSTDGGRNWTKTGEGKESRQR